MSLASFVLLAAVGPAGAVELDPDEAAQLAVRAAPQVRQAGIAADQAADAVALGALGFLPRIDLRGTYTHLSEVDLPPFEFGGVEIENPFPVINDTWSTRASATLPLTGTFLTTLPTFQAARSTASVLAWQEQAALQQTALQGRQAFYGAVRARAASGIADRSVELLEAHIADLEGLVTANLATRADLLQARAQLAEARSQQVASRGRASVAEDSLRILLGLPRTEPLVLQPDAGDDPTAADPEALLVAALADRPEVRSLLALVKAQDATVRATRGGQFPAISLFADADYANPNQRIIPSTDAWAATWDAGVVATWSPTDSIGRGVQVGRAKVQASQARQDLEALEDRIALEVSQATSDLAVASGILEAAREGLLAATEAFRVRTELLGAGEATPAELLDSEAALARAELAESDARIGLALARARIQHVIGRAAPPSTGAER